MKDKEKSKGHEDLLEIFHNNKPICQIIPTNPYKKVDTFDSMRPKPYTMRDYYISQTDTKLDAGPTKIHIQQTEATYEPYEKPPKPKKKRGIKYCSGGPPQWKFVDEIWREQQQKRHEVKMVEMVKRQKNKRIVEKLHKDGFHDIIVDRVGPAWFQELSPKQIITINNLKKCIIKDLNENTIINVKENIANLGLVLRPNPKHLLLALKECCQCPIEFLLILYQLINPRRSSYSINDRLLLSGVAHLAMRSTLRELHVRIPSPPPPQPVGKKQPKRIKREKFESPYLEPYTFQREKPRFTGVYYNKHVQRPESPYFDYLAELRQAIAESKQREIKEDEQDELLLEANYAQQVYEQLVDYRPVRSLLLPSKYTPCYNFKNPKPIIESSAHESSFVEEKISDSKDETVEDLEDEQVTKELVYVDVNENEEITENEKNDSIEEETEEQENTGTIKSESMVEEIEKSIASTIQDEHKLFECKKEALQYAEKPLCPCERCQNDRLRKERNLAAAKKREKEKEKLREKAKRLKEKEEARQKAIEEGEEVSEEIIEEEELEEEEVEEKDIEEQSSEIELKPTCSCYEKYKKRIETYENYQKRLNLYLSMKKQENRYVIGGVVMTPQGPIYQVNGIEPKRDCKCAIKYKQKLEEKRKIECMPQIPKGRTRYGICGVKETPQGNVYILNQAIPMNDCECMTTYKTFTGRHETCMEVYNEYMNKVNIMLEEHKLEFEQHNDEPNEFALHEDEITLESNEENDEECPDVVCEKEVNTEELLDTTEIENEEKDEEIKEEKIGCCEETVEEEEKVVCQPCQREVVDMDCKTRKEKKMKKKCCDLKKKRVWKCPGGCPKPKIKKPVCCKPSPCARIEEEVVEEVVEEEPPPPPPVLKRFFIYKNMRCKRGWQIKVLKKALNSMAEDGYPLAKLPEVYKLPHFKLWMQMRCGKFWTQADKEPYVLVSRYWWRHTDVCYEKIKSPQLNMTCDEARAYTWASAAKIKKMTSEAVQTYYRKVRQQNVHSGREFFPTMFNYEFPFWTFRDCYFSYIPTKEEEVLARAVWQCFETNTNK